MPHSIDIYRQGNKYVTVKPNDTSVQTKAVMGDNSIQLDFELGYEAKFQINDYCTVFNETYIIADNPPPVTKVAKFKYRYSLKMKSLASELEKVQYLFLGSDNTLREPEFSLMGNAQTFIDLLFTNITRVETGPNSFLTYPNPNLSGWTQGQIIPTDYKLITFSSDNCLSALSKIADAFSTEWWIGNKTISLTKVINDTGITLKHGRAKGLYEIQRLTKDNSKIITSIYPYGGSTNIPYDYGSQRLRLSAYPTNNVTRNENLYGVIEQSVIFDDIFPKRTGKVTAVDAVNFYKFTDSTMDFDLNSYWMPGLTPKLVFNTGQLAGYQFEVSSYNNSTKEITILKNKDETSLDIPSTSLKPVIGDTYVFVDIKLPATYVTAAESKLMQAAADYLIDGVSEPRFSFAITLDPVFVRNRNYSFSIGDLIWITDVDLDINRKIRVTQTSRNIVKENQYTLTLSDEVSQGTIQTINNNISSAQAGITQINNQINNSALFNGRVIGILSVEQGTIKLVDVPTTSTLTGFSQLVIEDSTGKIFKKV